MNFQPRYLIAEVMSFVPNVSGFDLGIVGLSCHGHQHGSVVILCSADVCLQFLSVNVRRPLCQEKSRIPDFYRAADLL